jgi:uncharacterized protein YegP (UPF0339 family)
LVDYIKLWKSPEDKQWYWRAHAKNGEPVAYGEGYRRKVDAKHVIKSLFPGVDIMEGNDAIPHSKGKQQVSSGKAVRSS